MLLDDHKPTLVMGAQGSIGRFVLQGLLDRHLPARASARRPDPARVPDRVEVFTADLTDPPSLTAAFAGVGQIFLYANRESVDGVVHAAETAGVQTIVLMSSGSVLHPTSVGNVITEEHRAVEMAFTEATDLTVIPIRPLVLATNALGWSGAIKAGETVPLYQPDALTAPIHERDIAAVAVAALVDRPSSSLSGILTGPARTSQRDQVAVIAATIGTSVSIAALSRDEALTRFSQFMPVREAAAVVQFLDDAAAGNSPATSTVADVLHRPPIDFSTWAADHADDFRRPWRR